MDEKKKWYTSKTVWANGIALVSAVLVATGVIAVDLSVSTVAIILVVINFALRMITKTAIEW